MSPRNVYRSELSPVTFLRRSADIFPDRVAVIHGERRYSYAELWQRVRRLANRLRRDGLQPRDRVAFLCPNVPALLEAHFAVPAAGGILVAINTRLHADEIASIVSHSSARWLFVDDEFAAKASSIRQQDLRVVRIADTGNATDPYENYLAEGSDAPVETWLEHEEQTLSINYTSGTTGQPKGVMYSHRGTYLNALSQVIESGLTRESVYLWALPMFHCNGWCYPWAVTAVAATHVCLRRLDFQHVWRLLRDEGITHYCGAPTVHTLLMNDPAAKCLQQPVTVMVAGAPPSPTLLARMRALNLRPVHVYGLTETYGPMIGSYWQASWNELSETEQATRLARQGHVQVAAEEVRVVDDSLHDVPRDGQTLGEVVMRGNTVALGYFENEAATVAAFAGDWFHSGDLAVWHPDGAIELRDRKKDIIISGGENISTIEVEQTLVRHPAVLECAVIAVPDEAWGERPKAFVCLRTGHDASERELIDFCRQHLAHFKCPVAIVFQELPKTSTGKVQKFLLREREWAGRDRRIN